MNDQKGAYPSLDTPAILVDMEKLEANIREMSQAAAEASVRLRPHVKVHESAEIAKMQIAAGACGIEVGCIDQGEAMAEEGVDDIVITHPAFYVSHKLETLKRLLRNPKLKIGVVVDMVEQAQGISQAGQAVGREVSVMIKIDVGKDIGGTQRYGVLPGEPTLDLAKKLCQVPNIKLTGIYGHEMVEEDMTPEGLDRAAVKTASIMTETAKMLRGNDIPIEHVSMGSSNTFHSVCRYLKREKSHEITEIHPGNFVIGDILYMNVLGNTRESCALTVLVTVISTSHPDWSVINAGVKTFGAESLIDYREAQGFFWEGKPSYGSVQGRPDLWLGALSGEISNVYYMDPKKKLSFGERLEIVPNNAALVVNMHDQLYGVRNGVVERIILVTGRGRGT